MLVGLTSTSPEEIRPLKLVSSLVCHSFGLWCTGFVILRSLGSGLRELLEKYVVPDAGHNRRGPRSRCLEGTREVVVAKVMEWIDGDSDRPICWFYGPAGFGKSAIAQTIAEQCAAADMLAASFFFSRGAGSRSRITGFITTLSYQLTISLPDTKPKVHSVLHEDPTIPNQSLEDQFQKLILNPVLALGEHDRPMVVVVDALDECDDKDSIAEFIGILLRYRQLPFHFLLTGRAENHILQMFAPPETHSTTYSLALGGFDARVDIHKFLQSQFSMIQRQNPRLMRGAPPSWPSASDIEGLVEKSSGLFIFASTLVDFVTDGRGAPQRKLQSVLEGHMGLDPLYTQVFAAAPRVDYFGRVISTIMLLREQPSVTELGCLLGLTADDVLQAAFAVQSILRIPEDNDNPIEVMHASLRDFLVAEQCSGIYFINPPICHMSIAHECLRIIMVDAKENKLATNGALLYACRNWFYHLYTALISGDKINFTNLSPGTDVISYLQDFKSQSFDYWVNTLLHDSEPFRPITEMRRQLKVGVWYHQFAQLEMV